IMITLAISQMAYFGATSLARYGGDDGLTLWGRSTLFGARVFDDPFVFYFTVLGVLVAAYLLCRAIVNARFGRVLKGIRESEPRMAALGYDVNRYRLVAFIIAGAICGLSGILLANLTEFVSPAYMSWGRSADLIIILVIGGLGRLHGALWGALVLLGLEEAIPYVFEDVLGPLFAHGPEASDLSNFLHRASETIAENWRVVLGPILILVALYARGGIVNVFGKSFR
ncbi:MAG: branched-chain amino acid ABC transporter permease, partial [Pseudomonadota bacterium]